MKTAFKVGIHLTSIKYRDWFIKNRMQSYIAVHHSITIYVDDENRSDTAECQIILENITKWLSTHAFK